MDDVWGVIEVEVAGEVVRAVENDGVYLMVKVIFFFQAEDGIRDAQESRGLGDVYKRQGAYKVTAEVMRGYCAGA